MGKIVGIIIAVLAIGFVLWVIISSIINKKKGKNSCCGFCEGCSHCDNGCNEK